MKSYKLIYDGVELGIVDTDREKNLHRYTHREGAMEELKEKGLCPFKFIDYSQDTDWIEPIPFVANRIRNIERFYPNPKVLGYHTDPFRLVLIEE